MAKSTKELKAAFTDAEQCFGKLYDATAAECKKCGDNAECPVWQDAAGDPSGKKSTKPTAAKSEKAAPAKPTKDAAKDSKPAPAKAEKSTTTKPAPSKVERAKDENGFTVGTAGAAIYKMLLEGTHTRSDIEKALDLEGKSTVGTFIGDLQRPVGVYSVSRGVKVLKAADTGILSLEGQEPVKAAKKGKK